MSTYIDGAADYVAASEQKLREAVKYKQAKVHSRVVCVCVEGLRANFVFAYSHVWFRDGRK